jgi:hypothetical protein
MSLESKYNNSFSKAACVTDAGLVGEYLHIKTKGNKDRNESQTIHASNLKTEQLLH